MLQRFNNKLVHHVCCRMIHHASCKGFGGLVCILNLNFMFGVTDLLVLTCYLPRYATVCQNKSIKVAILSIMQSVELKKNNKHKISENKQLYLYYNKNNLINHNSVGCVIIMYLSSNQSYVYIEFI